MTDKRGFLHALPVGRFRLASRDISATASGPARRVFSGRLEVHRLLRLPLAARRTAFAKRHVDVRGALCVAPEVPVGFQRMRVQIRARLAGADERLARKLEQAVEHCCIVLQTLRSGVSVDVTFHREGPSPAH